MTDEQQKALAKSVYTDLCKTIEKASIKYEKDEENLVVHFIMQGEDLSIGLILIVDADRQLIRILSPLPFKISKEKRVEGAVMTCIASDKVLDGNFDYDILDGTITFRMSASFRNSHIGENLFRYMVLYCCKVVDIYNDRFFAVDKGMMSLDDFIAEETE